MSGSTCCHEHEITHENNETISSCFELDWTFVKDELLFDREEEIEALEETFQRRIAPDSLPEFVLLSGKGGTGKTALARKLRHPVTSIGGFFLITKFDQLQRPQPYTAFVTAFTKFVQMLLARGSKPTEEFRNAVLNAVGPDSRLLIDMIPALEQILGSQDSIVVKGIETRARLMIAFNNFVRAVCSSECPIVLIMDDLQWADSESLDLLEVLVSGDGGIQGLLVVGVCRSNEVSVDDHFATMLRRLEDENKTLITHIEVHDLTQKAIKTMLSFALHLTEEKCTLLAAFLFAQTEGNPFYLLQMLQEIYYDGILVHDIQEHSQMVWDESKLNYFKDKDVVDLLSRKIERLPDETQTVLMAAACLGAEFSCHFLSKAMVNSDVKKALSTAVNKNIIIYDARYDTYVFRHDKIQQAAYSLIDESERALVHVSIGRQLWRTLSEQELYSNAFLIINQMMLGLPLLQDEEEKHDLAFLCLEAGKKAMISSDFKKAAILFWHGIKVCGERCWANNQYDLSLELYSSVAEAECINANFEKMDEAVDSVLSNALAFIDKVQVYSTQVYSLFARNCLQEAIELGLFVLDCLGEAFPSEIEEKTIHAELEKARSLLHGKSDAELLKIPDIDNCEKLAAMSLLNLLVAYTCLINPYLRTLIVTRFVMLSLNYGLCAYSAHGFSAYGTVCCRVGDWEKGYRYGKLALSILDRYGKSSIEWIPRVYTNFYGYIAPFRHPVRSVQAHLLRAEKTGMKTGDFEFAGFAAIVYGFNAFFSGKPLGEIKDKLDLLMQRFEEYKQSYHRLAVVIDLQMIHNFMGNSENPSILDGELFNEKRELELATSQNRVMFVVRCLIRKLMLAYYFDDLELALDIAQKTQHYEKSPNFMVYKIDSYLYSGLTYLAAARTTKSKEHLSEVKKNLAKLVFLSDACPNNCMHKVLLLEAELSSLGGNNMNFEDVSLPKYNNAIELARDEGYVHEQALACERAGWALFYHGKESRAVPYFRNAIDLYKQWGATAKANHMRKVFCSLKKQL